MTDGFVPLCNCRDLPQAELIRGSLVARGVPTFIDGVHQRGVLGLTGVVVDLRVMVLRSKLPLARELAAELIPDLASGEALDEDEALLEQPMSPSRRLPPEVLDETSNDLDDDADDDETPLPPRKSIGVALVVGMMGLSLGLLHVYMGKPRTGLLLFLVAVFGFGAMLKGNPEGGVLLASVWLFDFVLGILLIRRHNAAIDPRSAPAQ
jgi:hypothetical protein